MAKSFFKEGKTSIHLKSQFANPHCLGLGPQICLIKLSFPIDFDVSNNYTATNTKQPGPIYTI